MEINLKYLLFVFVVFIVSATAAFAQNIGASAFNNHPQMIVLADSPQHASQAGMAQEQDLRERGGSESAHGERPLWEVMPESHAVPLGDAARELRLEHATAKKAVIIWVN